MTRPGWRGVWREWREAATVGAGLAGSAALAAAPGLLPLPAEDPFRGTLALLPLLLGGFAALARLVRARGGHEIPREARLGEAAALAALVVAVLARPRLGLPHSAEALAAGLALVLAHRVTRQLVAARPLLGERLPRRPSIAFFLLPFLAYLALAPWASRHRQPDGDEPFYLLITHSLAYDLDADLTNNYRAGDWRWFMERPIEPQPGDPVGPNGELYSRHNELLPLALAPAYRLGGKAGALATMAALTALLAWLTLRLARHYVPDRPGEALAAYGLVAFAPPLLLYASQVWVEVPATVLAILALDRILGLGGDDVDPAAARSSEDGAQLSEPRRPEGPRGTRAREHRPQPTRRRATSSQPLSIVEWVKIGLPVLLLPLVKIRFMLLAVPLLALGWWRAGRPKRPIIVLAGLLGAVGGGILLHNQLVFKNPLKIHTWQEVELYQYQPRDFLEGAVGLFWDGAFGLFACAPIWLALLAALPRLVAVSRFGWGAGREPGPRAGRRRLLVDLAVLALPYLLIVAPRAEWYGGWSPPFRYALIALPLLGIALVPALAGRDRPGARALLAGLGALTLAATLLWIAVPGWTYNFADGRTYLLDGLSDRLASDVARLFPSAVRPRAATWAWPLATLVLVPLLWWLPGRRGGSAGAGAGGTRESWALAGVAAVLALAAAVPVAAARLPTRVIELEDPQVAKSGGHLHPDRWVIERTRFRGGWVLRVAERLEAPVVPGGRRAAVALQAEFVRNQPVPFTLDVYAGDRHVGSWTPSRARVWETVELGPVDWPAGAPLVLEARGPHPPGALNGAIIDRVLFDWR